MSDIPIHGSEFKTVEINVISLCYIEDRQIEGTSRGSCKTESYQIHCPFLLN